MNLHHVGVLVKDIAEASEHYRMLGYEPRTEIIHDPIQTAHVQFFRLEGDTVYVELVSPDGQQSKLSNALRKGGGLHHVCYATAGIEAACDELSAAGWFLISPPVAAVAFNGRRVSWLRGADRLTMELVEKGAPGEL